MIDFNWMFFFSLMFSFGFVPRRTADLNQIRSKCFCSPRSSTIFIEETATTTNRSIIVRQISKEPCWAELLDSSIVHAMGKWLEERSQQTQEEEEKKKHKTERKKEIFNENQLALYLRIFNMKLWDKVNEIKVETRIERKVNRKRRGLKSRQRIQVKIWTKTVERQRHRQRKRERGRERENGTVSA